MSVPPRIAFSTLAFPDATLAAAASLGRRWGYAGIELRLIDGELIDPAMPAAAGRRSSGPWPRPGCRWWRWTARSASPATTQVPSCAGSSSWPATGRRRWCACSAARWPRTNPARQEQLRTAARVLEAAVPLAERLGVAIGVETHDAFSASSVVAELLALVTRPRDSGAVGAVWDSHHPHRMGETPAEVYANLGPRILLAQVKDARRRADGDWQLVLLGEGEVPVRDMLGLLAAGGYPHWISVEWEKRWHPEIEEPEVALPQHLELLTKWLEAL